jgi:hypothetical protein
MGEKLGVLWGAWRESGPFGYLLVAVWLLLPFAFVTAIHPADAVQLWGFAVPSAMTSRALYAGEAVALLALAALFLLQFWIVTMIYRRAQFFVPLWPVAALVCFIGNGVWWLWTGYIDPVSAIAGFLPLASAIASQGICERLASDFVFGPGPKPTY